MILYSQKQREEIALHAQKQQEQKTELKYEGSVRMYPGMTYWELNTETAEIKPAEFESEDYFIGKMQSKRKRLILKPNCLHVPAINKENAERKFKKLLLQILK